MEIEKDKGCLVGHGEACMHVLSCKNHACNGQWVHGWHDSQRLSSNSFVHLPMEAAIDMLAFIVHACMHSTTTAADGC